MTEAFPVLPVVQTDAKAFVDFWERLYSEKDENSNASNDAKPYGTYDEKFYRENIGQPLTGERIARFFEWKNGGPLSKLKAKSILRYSMPEERISSDADPEMLRAFLSRPGGTIWRIFWLHLQYSEHFPIYDQHVHRAMAFLLKWTEMEIPKYDSKKIEMYTQEYMPFTKRFDGCDRRKVDRALWTFGRFLSLGYAKALKR